jgi:hypothetical protein
MRARREIAATQISLTGLNSPGLALEEQEKSVGDVAKRLPLPI